MHDRLESKIGYTFKNKDLLAQALTHVSYARERGTSHYETLEFLGDALLNFLVVDILVEGFPGKKEGVLASLKAYLISEEFFYELSKELQLSDHILISRGKKNVSIVSDVFEALWAAVYIDSGRDCNLVKELFRRLFMERILGTVKDQGVRKDYKTILQEITQKRWKERPTYRIIGIEGPEHAKVFTVESSVRGISAVGKGRSKKEAEQDAAKKLVEKLESEGP